MAEATSREECVERHRGYPIDMSRRLTAMQRERLTEMVRPIRNGEVVLDVGCNSGHVVEFLPRRCRVLGVDVSEELVALARERLADAQVAAAESLPFPLNSVDAVILGEIIEHVHDPVEVLREAARVARRVVVGSTPHEGGDWGPEGKRAPSRHRFHVRCYTEATLRSALEAAGLGRVEVSSVPRVGIPQVYIFAGYL